MQLSEPRQLTEHFGSEIDAATLLSSVVEPEDRAQVRSLLLKRLVLVARGLSLDAPALWNLFTSLFEPVPIPYARSPILGTLIPVEREPSDDGWFLGGDWHTDMGFMERPPDVSMLYGDVVPSGVGDTIFVDRRAPIAYLSPGLRQFLANAQVVDTSERSFGSRGFYSSAPTIGIDWEMPSQLQAQRPCMMEDPTGASFVTIDPCFSDRFAGWSTTESAGLLAYLASFVTREEFQLRIPWQPGTLVLSANRVVAHRVMCDFAGKSRRLIRGNGYVESWDYSGE